MLYASLLFAFLISTAQESAPAEAPPAALEESYAPEAEPQAAAQQEAAPKAPTQATPETAPPAPVAAPTPPPAPVAPIGPSKTFDVPRMEMKNIEGKEMRQQVLSKFCTTTGLGNCTLDIMKPKRESLSGPTMSLISLVDGTQESSSVITYIIHSPKTFTRKEAIEFLSQYRIIFPEGIDSFAPSRVLSPKTKRRSSLTLEYEWTVDIGLNKLPGRLFVLKNPKTQSSFLVFAIAQTKKEMNSSRLVKFLHSELDMAK